mmetsp:Transcript_18803/g.20924  ORF Transcript_18803/g.20924 Transcript_18803/m.20924 type:complete len:258 (-) Transcript_18803:66-839(-)
MLAVFRSADVFKKLVVAIKDLVVDVNIHATEQGISLQAMDATHVSLVAFVLHGESIERYECNKPLKLGVNLPMLAKIVRCAANDAVMTLEVDEQDLEVLTIQFETPNKLAQFSIRLLDLDADELKIPDTEFTATVTLNSSVFQQTLRNLAAIGDVDAITITAEEQGITFAVADVLKSQNGLIRLAIDDNDEGTQIDLDEDAVSMAYSLSHMNKFTKATPLSSNVQLSLSDEVPLVVEYAVVELGLLKFYLAPKIDDG